MRQSLALISLVAVALAGCADDPSAPANGDDVKFDDVDVPDDKGIIRGIVFDAAITPIEGATIKIQGNGMETKSNADGAFLFTDLEPGTYFLDVSRLGYTSVQTSADVVAGVEKPAILKVQLAADASNLPYTEQYQFEGFMECTATTPAVGANVCGLVDDFLAAGLDDSQVRYPFSGTPMWAQTELVWESSQPLGDALSLMYSYGDCGSGFYCDHEVEGPSVLTVTANQTVLEDIVAQEGELYIRVFGTESAQGEGTGLGATTEQRFTHYTTIFYGFTPEPGWLFTRDGPHPVPS